MRLGRKDLARICTVVVVFGVVSGSIVTGVGTISASPAEGTSAEVSVPVTNTKIVQTTPRVLDDSILGDNQNLTSGETEEEVQLEAIVSPSVVATGEEVHIFVLNAETGQRVENATVTVGDKKLETYYPGQTGFTPEEVGEFTVTVAKQNTTSTRYINDTAELSVVSEAPGGTAGETSVELVPASQTVAEGESVPFDAVVTDASGGVGEWNISVRIRDTNATSRSGLTALVTGIIEIPPHLSGSKSISHSGNVYSGRSGYARSIVGNISLEGANSANSGRVTIVRFVVRGQTSGTVPVTLSVDELRDENGNSYDVMATENATLTVEEEHQLNKDDSDIGAIEVISIDGNGTFDSGAFRHYGFDTMRINATTPDGDPLTRGTLSINLTHTNRFGYTEVYPLRFERQSEETYVHSDLPGPIPTQFLTLSTAGGNITTQVPVTNAFGRSPALRYPVEGWAVDYLPPEGYRTVRVDGETYYAIRLHKNHDPENVTLRQTAVFGRTVYREAYSGDQAVLKNPVGWAVFDTDGRPVRDQQVRRRAALTAFVVEVVERRGRDQMIGYLGEEYPTALREVRRNAELSRGILAVRDTAAEGLGEVVGAAVSGGASAVVKRGAAEGAEKVAKEGAEEAAERAATKVRREFVADLVKNYLPSDDQLENQPLSTMKEGFRLKANDELGESAEQAENASHVLRTHPPDETWSYQDADRFWRNYNESLTDGIFYMKLRAELLPEGDARTQLKDVTLQVASGGSGIPVDEVERFYRLLTTERLGYLSEAINATEYLYAKQGGFARRYGSWSADAHRAAIETQTGSSTTLFEPVRAESDVEIEAMIESFSPVNETAVPGERLVSRVTVRNTGSQAHTFFVGYSARDPNGTYYDNFGTTGRQVELSPGEQTTVTVDWTVEGRAPAGTYDLVTAIWKESDRERLETRLDSITREGIVDIQEKPGSGDGTSDVLYVVDSGSIEKISVDGTVSTVVSEIGAKGIASAPDGTFWVTQQAGIDEPEPVRHIDRQGNVLSRFPSQDEKSRGIDFDSQGAIGEEGLLYMMAGSDGNIYQFDQNGTLLDKFSVPTDRVSGISISDQGYLWMVSRFHKKVYKIDISGGDATVVDSWSPGFKITGIAVTDSSVWLSDKDDSDIYQYSKTGEQQSTVSVGVGVNRALDVPEDMNSDQTSPDVTGDGNPARDPDNDDLYEDVNGDGDVTPGDATVLFNAVFESNPTVTQNVGSFDFNGDGSVTPGDATVLFNEIF